MSPITDFVLQESRNVRYKAVQYRRSDSRSPLLPPNRFLVQGQEIIIDDVTQARTAYQRLIALPTEKYKMRQYLRGSRHEQLFEGHFELIDSRCGSIEIALEGTKETTIVRWRTDSEDTGAIAALARFNTINFSGSLNGNCRQGCDDLGQMYVYGMRSMGTVDEEEYKFNRHLHLVAETALLMTKHYKKYFSSASREIEFMNSKKKRMKGMGGCMVSEIISAKNQINAAHIDCNDKAISLSTWVEDRPGSARGWAFVLPNVTIDGVRAVAIKLRHGRSIEWDGRIVHHCSTFLDRGENNNVYGYYHGAR